MGKQKVLIERFPTVEHSFKTEMIQHMLSRLIANGRSFFGCSLNCHSHTLSQSGGIARRRKPAGAAFQYGLARAGNIGCDCRQPACCSFKQGHWQALPEGREYESVGGLHPAPHVWFKAEEVDPGIEVESG